MDDMKISGFLGAVAAKTITAAIRKKGYNIEQLRFNSINVHNQNGATTLSVSAEVVVPDETVSKVLKDVMK